MRGVNILVAVYITLLISDFHSDVNTFSWKVWEKLEWAKPTKAGNIGLDKSTSEVDNSYGLNDADYTSMINGIVDLALL